MVAAAAAVATLAAALRIISLAPALTEDLFAIGAGPQVVGVDGYSDRPAAARSLPHIGSMRTVDSEAILALHPDLIVGIPYSAPQLAQFAGLGIATRALEMQTLADDYTAIGELGRLTGHTAAAARVVAGLRHRIAAVSRATARLGHARALVVISVDPIYTAAEHSFIDDLLLAAHVDNVARGAHAAFPNLSAEIVERDDPDVIVTTPNLPIPADRPPWSRLRAVRDRHVIAVAESDLFRPGPHVADVLEALVRRIAPYRPRTARSAKVTTLPSAVRRTASGIP